MAEPREMPIDPSPYRGMPNVPVRARRSDGMAYDVLGKIRKVEPIPANSIDRKIVDAIAALASPSNPLSNILFNIQAEPMEVVVRFDSQEAPDMKLTITAEVALDLDVLGK